MDGIRIGNGYDVHRLAPGRRLVLGGVVIPYNRGLEGHSDADVLTHAVMDAILGALALGDIGRHFSDTEEAFHGADSLELLRRVTEMMRERGYRIGNLDATVIAQAPRLAPHIPSMRDKLAGCLEAPVDCVSVKATTEEGLGFTGAGEGISAHCVCLLVRNR